VARDLGDLNREDFARYKSDVKKEGKAFFPFAILADTVMSLVVVSVITALACIWYLDADGTEPGILGPWYTEPADPGTTQFVPRPDWYFYFLFYLLRIFKWPETVFIATVGIPTVLLILLLGLPFYDRRRERRPSRRPVAIASIRASVSVRRSRKARVAPVARVRSRSARLASRMAAVFSSSPRAICCKASFLVRVEQRASSRAASRAARALPCTSVVTSMLGPCPVPGSLSSIDRRAAPRATLGAWGPSRGPHLYRITRLSRWMTSSKLL